MRKISTKTKTSVISMTNFNEIWDRIAEDVADAFRMDDEEKSRFRNKPLARLIAAIPFMAGCEDAERTAVSHLGIYVLSNRETKQYYNAQTGDNETVFERLRLISSFKGGNKDIIGKGMSLIALTMLNDYKRDIYIDETLGKYNPVSDDVFDFEELKKELEYTRRTVDCEEMDALYSDEDVRGYWGH